MDPSSSTTATATPYWPSPLPPSSSSSSRTPSPPLAQKDLLAVLRCPVNEHVVEYIVDRVAETVAHGLGRPRASTSSLLSHSVPSSAKLSDAQSQATENFSVFVAKVLRRADVSMSVVIGALIYIHRARAHLRIAIEEWALHRVFLGSLILAAKYLNDSSLKNAHWALCTRLFGKRDVARVEREFLDVLNWELAIRESDVEEWAGKLLACRCVDLGLEKARAAGVGAGAGAGVAHASSNNNCQIPIQAQRASRGDVVAPPVPGKDRGVGRRGRSEERAYPSSASSLHARHRQVAPLPLARSRAPYVAHASAPPLLSIPQLPYQPRVPSPLALHHPAAAAASIVVPVSRSPSRARSDALTEYEQDRATMMDSDEYDNDNDDDDNVVSPTSSISSSTSSSSSASSSSEEDEHIYTPAHPHHLVAPPPSGAALPPKLVLPSSHQNHHAHRRRSAPYPPKGISALSLPPSRTSSPYAYALPAPPPITASASLSGLPGPMPVHGHGHGHGHVQGFGNAQSGLYPSCVGGVGVGVGVPVA